MNSGQVFLWRRDGKYWYGVNGQDVLKCDGTGVVGSYGSDGACFFRDDDMQKVAESISRDRVVRKAVAQYPGLRLLRQDPFQCCITFIASSNASIQKIRSSLEELCTRFGKKVRYDGKKFFLFPRPTDIAGASVSQVMQCGLGYRAGYVMRSSEMIQDRQVDFEAVRKMGYHTAKEELRVLPGVGNKVADCMLLFALDKTEAFPLDRWVARILQKYYSGRFGSASHFTDRQYDRLHGDIVGHFGPYAGYAQQFLFKMEREEHRKKW